MAERDRIIIAGGGPVGLCVALALAAQDIPVLVLEAEAAPLPHQRGGAFHPPTLELLEPLGILPEMQRLGVAVPIWRIMNPDRQIIAEFDLRLIAAETPFPYRFHLGLDRFVPILVDRLTKMSSAEIRFAAPVVAACQNAEQIEVTIQPDGGVQETIVGRWVVGAEGAHSIVRKAANIAFDGFTWPERFLHTNILRDLESEGFAGANYISDPDHWAVVLKLDNVTGEPVWRVTFGTSADTSEDILLAPEHVDTALDAVLPGMAPFIVRNASLYRVHQRVASSFVQGRMLLAGNAAHVNNPLGGFGLNSGIHDAFNLAEKLAAVWHNTASFEHLDLYNRQRRSVTIDFIQAASIRNKRLIEERDPVKQQDNQNELRRTANNPDLARQYLLNSSMISSIRAAAAIQ